MWIFFDEFSHIEIRELILVAKKPVKLTDEYIDNINDYMDYSLVESDDTVPSEAIHIAEILDVDNDFIGLAKSKLNAE